MDQLNRQIIGWANYFCLGPVSKAYRVVEEHTRRRLRQWLCAPNINGRQPVPRYSDQLLHDQFGLVRLAARTASFPWRHREPFSERRMTEMCLSSSMSGNRKQNHVKPD